MRNSVLTTDGRTDGDTSAHVELRFAAKNYSSSIVWRLLFSSLSNDWSFLNRSASISVGILVRLFLDFTELERLEFEEPFEINIEFALRRIMIGYVLYLDLQSRIPRTLISEEANESASRRRHQSLHGEKLFRHPATGMRRTKSSLSLVSITQRRVRSSGGAHWRGRECERWRNVWSSAKTKANILFHDQ